MESVEQNNSKKKLIVPLIALMLCAVAVIGIGYGLTSTSSNSGNSVTGTGLVVNLTDGATESAASLGAGAFATGNAISYYTTQNDGTTTYTVTGAEIGKGTLKITSTDTSKTVAKVTAKLTLADCDNPSAFKFTMDSKTLTVGSTTDLKDVTLASGEASKEYTLTLGADDTSVKPDVDFTYTIVFSVTVG